LTAISSKLEDYYKALFRNYALLNIRRCWEGAVQRQHGARWPDEAITVDHGFRIEHVGLTRRDISEHIAYTGAAQERQSNSHHDEYGKL
jgi:hypothetical protein